MCDQNPDPMTSSWLGVTTCNVQSACVFTACCYCWRRVCCITILDRFETPTCIQTRNHHAFKHANNHSVVLLTWFSSASSSSMSGSSHPALAKDSSPVHLCGRKVGKDGFVDKHAHIATHTLYSAHIRITVKSFQLVSSAYERMTAQALLPCWNCKLEDGSHTFPGMKWYLPS
jgi:hypothetical protein